MQISPSLSRKLRETLGQDAGGDLVTWLDEQRDQSEQLHADMAELRQEIHALKADLARQFAHTNAKLSAQIADVKSDLMKWSFVFWCGAVTAVAALAGVLR